MVSPAQILFDLEFSRPMLRERGILCIIHAFLSFWNITSVNQQNPFKPEQEAIKLLGYR